MPTAKPATKKPVKKKAPVKKAVEATQEVVAPSEEVTENQAEVGAVEAAVDAPAEEVVSPEADVQVVTLVSLSLTTGGSIQFDTRGYIATAEEVWDNIGQLLPKQIYIPNMDSIVFIKVDHMSEEDFIASLQQQQQQADGQPQPEQEAAE